MSKDANAARLPFISLWIILLTCVATDIFYLKNPVLLLSALPLAAVLIVAMLRIYKRVGKTDG